MSWLDTGCQRSRSQQAVEVARASTSMLGHQSQSSSLSNWRFLELLQDGSDLWVIGTGHSTGWILFVSSDQQCWSAKGTWSTYTNWRESLQVIPDVRCCTLCDGCAVPHYSHSVFNIMTNQYETVHHLLWPILIVTACLFSLFITKFTILWI